MSQHARCWRRRDRFAEREPDLPGWIVWGEEPVFAVEFTPGGAPIGSTLDEVLASADVQRCVDEDPFLQEWMKAQMPEIRDAVDE